MANVKLTDIMKNYVDGATSGWVEKFELVAELQKIESLESVFPVLLQGPAFSAVYKQLITDVRNDFAQAKKALAKAFGLSRFDAYRQFRDRVLSVGESVDVFASA